MSQTTKHTMEDDFQHFLSYSSLSGEPADLIRKLRKAYEANWVAPFYDNKGRPHDTMPIGEDTGLPLYRAAATPAQPIAAAGDPLPGFVPAFVRLDGARFDGLEAPVSHRTVSNGPSLHVDLSGWMMSKIAQPIADMSAPTDERAAFEAVARTFLPDLWVNPVRLNESYADKELRTGWEFWKAARAAAPVSGPSDATNFERMFVAACDDLAAISDILGLDSDIEGGAAPIIEAIESLRTAAPMPSRFDLEAMDRAMDHMGNQLNEMDAVEESDEQITAPGFEAIARLLEAAPVSGQGASLPQMTEQQVADALVENDPLTMVSIRRLLNGDPVTINLPELTRIVGHCIDSRPRSEDSRAKALEEAVQACQALRDPDPYGWNAEFKDRGFEQCIAAIRALASTTPQKADNE